MVVLLPAGAGRAGLTPPIRDTAYTRGTRYPCRYRPRGPYWYRAITNWYYGPPRCEIAYMSILCVDIQPTLCLSQHPHWLAEKRQEMTSSYVYVRNNSQTVVPIRSAALRCA